MNPNAGVGGRTCDRRRSDGDAPAVRRAERRVVIVREATTGSAPVARPAAGATPTGAVKPELVVFYLHGKVRCVTCNDIERIAREAVESGFVPEIQAGRLEWRVVDYEERGNEHYATDYKLAAPCVVLASMRAATRCRGGAYRKSGN